MILMYYITSTSTTKYQSLNYRQNFLPVFTSLKNSMTDEMTHHSNLDQKFSSNFPVFEEFND